MKKLLTILLAVVMLIGAMSLAASAAMPSTYYAPYGSVTVDGVVSDGEWDAASYVELANVITEMPMLADPIMKIMHDGTDMYILVEVMTPDVYNDNIFICTHVPHEGCTLNGCTSYLRLVVDGAALAKKGASYQAWGYWSDANFDGVNDFTRTKEGDETDLLREIVYGYADGVLYAEMRVAATYGEAIPVGEVVNVSVRVDDNNFPPLSSQAWSDQPFTWDNSVHFNPADAGEVIFLAEGEVPEQTTPVDTAPVDTEADTTEADTTEADTTEADIGSTDTTAAVTEEDATAAATDASTDEHEPMEPAASSFPVVPVVIIAVVVVLAVIAGIIAKKKKK